MRTIESEAAAAGSLPPPIVPARKVRLALLLTPALLPRIIVGERGEARHYEEVEREPAILDAGQTDHLDRHHDVLEHRTPVEQQRVLEDDADIDARLRHRPAGDLDHR